MIATEIKSEVFLLDCVEGMKAYPDNHFDLAIVDPPYGININENMGLKKGNRKRHTKKAYWDSEIPSDEYFNELRRVSENQIIWGGNYFPQIWKEGCKHFIFWDKLVPEAMSFSDGELAWTSFNKANKKFTLRNSGNNVSIEKIHPTQKPVALYEWILKNYAKQGDTILDTHLGSMSSRIAAHKNGFDFTGFEIDPDYFRDGNRRFEDYKKQLRLF